MTERREVTLTDCVECGNRECVEWAALGTRCYVCKTLIVFGNEQFQSIVLRDSRHA